MCTSIRLKAKDGAVIYARTMEFGVPLFSELTVVPRGRAYRGTSGGGAPGHSWETKYAAVGVNAFAEPHIIDGLNEAGLAGGALLFPKHAGYVKPEAAAPGKQVAPWEFLTWVLTRFASVKEAKDALSGGASSSDAPLQIVDVPPPGAHALGEDGQKLELHYVVHDRTGASLVIEPIDGGLVLHDNPFGVMTNSPPFDWHVTNLANYVGLRATNAAAVDIDSQQVTAVGQGSGMLGLPGDFTPPARFVRALTLVESARQAKNAGEGILLASRIMHHFDIPLGLVREAGSSRARLEYTLWTTYADLQNKSFYFSTYENPQLREVKMPDLELDAIEVRRTTMQAPVEFFPVKPLAAHPA
jgi:choloylglycine hydrolase